MIDRSQTDRGGGGNANEGRLGGESETPLETWRSRRAGLVVIAS